MSSEILAALIGPLLTALVTGGGVALREALQQRDARQKARRRLGEAKEAVTFIQSWVVAQESLLSPDERASMHLRVRADLDRIYIDGLQGAKKLEGIADKRDSWTLERLINSALFLRVRDRTQPESGIDSDKQGISYRHPVGAACIVRPLYWLGIGWACIWAVAAFAAVPDYSRNALSIIGELGLALLITVLAGVLPVAAVRALVLFLDQRAANQVPQAVIDLADSPNSPAQSDSLDVRDARRQERPS